MKSLLSGILFACAAATLAAQATPSSQSSAPSQASGSQVSKTVTLTGCVGGSGTAISPYMLSNATEEGSGSKTGSTAGSGTTTPGNPGTSSGQTGSSSQSSSASSSGSSYRLTGATNMQQYVGKRVEVVGAIVPASGGQPQEFRVTTAKVVSATGC